jgi:hypothetical protein
MALPSRLAFQFRSSVALIRNGVVRRGFSSQSAGTSRSILGNAAPFLIGATAATATLFAAKHLYDNKDKYVVLQPVHAASRIVVGTWKFFCTLNSIKYIMHKL